MKRKDALGLLSHTELEERFTKTRSEIVALIRIAMGGLVAEQQWFGEAGTGPAADLHAATTLAAQMVGSLGMAGSLIPYDAMDLIGSQNVVAKVLANDASREALEEILDDAKRSVEAMLAENGHVVEALRDALLDREELIGDEIVAVVNAARPSAPAPFEVDLRETAEVETAEV